MNFGGPTDPGWAPFSTGLESNFKDLSKPCPRWHPRDAKWYTYDATWTLGEVAVPDLDPGSSIDVEMDFSNGLRRHLKVSSFGLDKVFEKVRDTEKARRGQYSNLVWNPETGAWRQATRSASPPPPPPAGCERQIARINEMLARGVITQTQADEAIADILRNCT